MRKNNTEVELVVDTFTKEILENCVKYTSDSEGYEYYIKETQLGMFLLVDNFSTTPFVLTKCTIKDNDILPSLEAMYQDSIVATESIEEFKEAVQTHIYLEAKELVEKYLALD
ncbi:hypothetical protein [Lysinibacillus sphaericus]|uniref:Uncharacterized protein n=1 Tax=Lysinibacillus sphaericus TaxID=1421 RepID=A0A6G9ZZN4_LYSSH|nr:hypothetical protein [Lysinibacillus sphaericus]QIS31242.1 hypothetical protein [Lysinibacillus sphaericus]QPA61371.1 hypothetical protein INQ55_23880 [Lysinibacillus sphaericus]